MYGSEYCLISPVPMREADSNNIQFRFEQAVSVVNVDGLGNFSQELTGRSHNNTKYACDLELSDLLWRDLRARTMYTQRGWLMRSGTVVSRTRDHLTKFTDERAFKKKRAQCRETRRNLCVMEEHCEAGHRYHVMTRLHCTIISGGHGVRNNK